MVGQRYSRSATGRGPGDRSGHGGSSGSISIHKSSSAVCKGTVTLAAAQKAIVTYWTTALSRLGIG
jgi:hypothetical protein